MSPLLTSTTWSTCPSESIHGKFNGTLKAENGKVVMDGKSISIFQEQVPTSSQRDDAGAECAAASTGIFTIVEEARAHLKDGTKMVIISAPSANAPMFVMGVNHKK